MEASHRRAVQKWAPGVTLTVFGALLGTAICEDARACSPGEGHVDSVIPDDGTHPANAAIILTGHVLERDYLSATIDGQEARLIVDTELSARYPRDDAYDILALRLEPTPSPGQTVALAGNACRYNPDQSCEEFELTYVAEEPDISTPSPPVEWWWDATFYEPPDDPEAIYETNSCSYLDRGGNVTVTVQLAQVPPLDDPLHVRVWGSPESWTASSYGTGRFLAVNPVQDERFTEYLPLYVDQVRYPVTENSYCIYLELRDLAGNSSGVEEKCMPCRLRRHSEFGDYEECYPAAGLCGADADPALKQDACFVDDVSPDAGADTIQDGGALAVEAGTRSAETEAGRGDAGTRSSVLANKDAAGAPAEDGNGDRTSESTRQDGGSTSTTGGDGEPSMREPASSRVGLRKNSSTIATQGCAVAPARPASNHTVLPLLAALIARRRRWRSRPSKC